MWTEYHFNSLNTHKTKFTCYLSSYSHAILYIYYRSQWLKGNHKCCHTKQWLYFQWLQSTNDNFFKNSCITVVWDILKPDHRNSTNSFVLQKVWLRWLRGAAVWDCREMWTQNDPSLCWLQTARHQANSRPRQDPGFEAETRSWAEQGSGHNPRSVERQELGEIKERKERSWRMTRCWKGGRWNCHIEALLLWLWRSWGRRRAEGLHGSFCPFPEEEGRIATNVRKINTICPKYCNSFARVPTAFVKKKSKNKSYWDIFRAQASFILSVWYLVARPSLCETCKFSVAYNTSCNVSDDIVSG